LPATVVEVHLQKSPHGATMADDHDDYDSEFDEFDDDDWSHDNRLTIRKELIDAGHKAKLGIRKYYALVTLVMASIPHDDYTIPFLCKDISIEIRPRRPTRKCRVTIRTATRRYDTDVSFPSPPTRSSARLRAQRA
jgi:hypothetical protein